MALVATQLPFAQPCLILAGDRASNIRARAPLTVSITVLSPSLSLSLLP